ETGYDSWKTGADYSGNAAVWPTFTADDELGYVYLPVEAATNDIYGGNRLGNNLYTSTLVCEALKGLTIPRTGSVSHAGMLVTKTLLLAGEGLTGQPFFRAHDKKTGQILWETRIPTSGPQSGLPMTYT